MDLENLKARYYMLLGQAEEAKNIYQRALTEVTEAQKKQQEEEAKKNEDPKKQPEPTATPGPETPRQ